MNTEIQEFTQEQMLEIKEQEKDFPIQKKWFKHKEKGHYQYQIMLTEMNDFEEVAK